MLLDQFNVSHSIDLEETVHSIRSRNPYFSKIRAEPQPGWRYRFNRVTLGTVRIGTSEVTSLSYQSDFSSDVVITGCFGGVEALSTRRDTRSLSRLPTVSPNFPASGIIKNAAFYTVRLSPEILAGYLRELEIEADLNAFIERNWLTPVENSLIFDGFIQHLLRYIDHVGDMIQRERNTLEEMVYINAARLFSSNTRNYSFPGNTKTLQRCIDFIRHHMAEDISALDVAKASGLSIRSVQLLFRKHLDRTITEYMTDQRMEAARKLLLSGSITSVQDACVAVGVPNLSYFSRLYRLRYGETPSTTLRSRY